LHGKYDSLRKDSEETNLKKFNTPKKLNKAKKEVEKYLNCSLLRLKTPKQERHMEQVGARSILCLDGSVATIINHIENVRSLLRVEVAEQIL
jgi:hypothetical protein